MKVKKVWSEEDFGLMGWHDSRLYSIDFPKNDLKLSMTIDYIFKWEKQKDSNYKFWVSQCDLVFLDVFKIKINIDFEDYVDLYVESIERKNPRSSNDKKTYWDYTIYLDKGFISFNSSGFKQYVKTQPILSESQTIDRGYLHDNNSGDK